MYSHPILRALITGAAVAAFCLPASTPAHAQSSGTVHPLPPAIQIVRQASTDAADRTAAPLSVSVPTDLYSHGDPTDEEQYILELINRARANPAAEGRMLASVSDPALLFAYKSFNVDTNKLKTDFAGYPVRPPLAFNVKLITAARLHSKDMSDNNFQGHTGSNGSQLDTRVNNQGYVGWSALGENVFAYAQSLMYAHVAFNVDWGNADLGHRENIMNFKSNNVLTEIGIGVLHDDRPSPHVGPIIVTENFGNAKQPFIVGVVYEDKNSNGMYDLGEGIPNVTVTPSAGKYYAVTSASGGYAFPELTRGDITVTASGGTLGGDMARTVAVDNDNVKVDFVKGAASLPGAVTLVTPLPGPMAWTGLDVRFNWRAVATATSYQIQVGTDSAFASGILHDTEVSDTTALLNGFAEGGRYFWRVRAKNGTGPGAYSGVRVFRMLAPLKAVELVGPANGGTIATNNTTFQWHRGSTSETGYEIQFASDAAFTTIVARDTAVFDTATVMNGLPAGTRLYWRVRAKNALGPGPFSEIWNVTTSTSSVASPESAARFHLSEATPNPVTGVATLAFETAASGTIELSIVDGLGREVAVIAAGPYAAGRHVATWDASSVPSGIYYGRLRGGESTASTRMIVRH